MLLEYSNIIIIIKVKCIQPRLCVSRIYRTNFSRSAILSRTQTEFQSCDHTVYKDGIRSTIQTL